MASLGAGAGKRRAEKQQCAVEEKGEEVDDEGARSKRRALEDGAAAPAPSSADAPSFSSSSSSSSSSASHPSNKRSLPPWAGGADHIATSDAAAFQGQRPVRLHDTNLPSRTWLLVAQGLGWVTSGFMAQTSSEWWWATEAFAASCSHAGSLRGHLLGWLDKIDDADLESRSAAKVKALCKRAGLPASGFKAGEMRRMLRGLRVHPAPTVISAKLRSMAAAERLRRGREAREMECPHGVFDQDFASTEIATMRAALPPCPGHITRPTHPLLALVIHGQIPFGDGGQIVCSSAFPECNNQVVNGRQFPDRSSEGIPWEVELSGEGPPNQCIDMPQGAWFELPRNLEWGEKPAWGNAAAMHPIGIDRRIASYRNEFLEGSNEPQVLYQVDPTEKGPSDDGSSSGFRLVHGEDVEPIVIRAKSTESYRTHEPLVLFVHARKPGVAWLQLSTPYHAKEPFYVEGAKSYRYDMDTSPNTAWHRNRATQDSRIQLYNHIHHETFEGAPRGVRLVRITVHPSDGVALRWRAATPDGGKGGGGGSGGGSGGSSGGGSC